MTLQHVWNSLGTGGWIRLSARVLALVWACFWVWFALASAAGEFRTEGWGASVSHLIQAAIIALLFVLLWRWEIPGGALMLMIAGLMAWFFHLREPFVAVILLGPPIVSGVLSLTHGLWTAFHPQIGQAG